MSRIRTVSPGRPGDPDPLPPLPASLEGMIRLAGDEPVPAGAAPQPARPSRHGPVMLVPAAEPARTRRDVVAPQRRLRLLLALLVCLLVVQAATLLLVALQVRLAGQGGATAAATDSAVQQPPARPALVIDPTSPAAQDRVSVTVLNVTGQHVGTALDLRTGQSIGFALSSTAATTQEGSFAVGSASAPGVLSVLPGDQIAVTTSPYTAISVLTVGPRQVTPRGR